MEDRIEQRITIRATQDKVWQLVTRPGWWLPGSIADRGQAPGQVSVGYGGDARPYVIDIVRLEPRGYASFRWASRFGGAEPSPGRATLVEFYLRPVGDETGVTVVESGFTSLDLPEALREDERKGNKGGWQYELAGLRTRAEQLIPQGTPRTPAGIPPEDDPPCPCGVRPSIGKLTRSGCSPPWRTRAAVNAPGCSAAGPARAARGLAARRSRCHGRRSRSIWLRRGELT